MSQPIVLQLQELASDGSHDISDLLRKALLVATKLQLDDFKDWIRSELDGYKDAEKIPEYRVIYGDLRAQNPYRGLIPFTIGNSELSEAARKIHIHESVASIQQLTDSTQEGAICYAFSPEQEAALMRMQSGYVQLRPIKVVGRNQLQAILQAVRTRILEWSLSLESAGILGHGFSFSDKERSAAMSNKTFQIQNFQGVLGDVSGGVVSQTNTITVVSGNFDSLANYLRQQGVPDAEIRVLEGAVQEDPEPSKSNALGPKVSAWIGRMVALAASGGWDVSVATAGTLLAAAIAKFYGL